MKIIPAIDILDGKCVRLTQGDFLRKKIYSEDPVKIAVQFEAAGLRRLHLVDLDGAKAGAIKNLQVLKNIAAATTLEIDFGGGIKQERDLETVFKAGAHMAAIGSLAVQAPGRLAEWIRQYGAGKFFIGADVRGEKIQINGWLDDGATGIFSFVKKMNAIGAQHFFCTDIQKDGAMQGAAVELYKKITVQFPGIQLTASGGVTTTADLDRLQAVGCAGAIIGKAIYEQTISLEALSKY